MYSSLHRQIYSSIKLIKDLLATNQEQYLQHYDQKRIDEKLCFLGENKNGQVDSPLPEVLPLGAALGAQVASGIVAATLYTTNIPSIQNGHQFHLGFAH